MKTMLTVMCSLLSFTGAAVALEPNISISVPAVVQVESGTEGILPIEIDRMGNAPNQAIVLIKGIPSSVSLTEGRLFPSGVWALKAAANKQIRLMTSTTTVEQTPLSISLVALDGTEVSRAATQLVVAPKQPPATGTLPSNTAPVAAIRRNEDIRPPQDSPGGKAAVSPADKRPTLVAPIATEKVLKLMETGDRYLSEGKIAFARRFYQLAAEMGWAEGALAMARTYDQAYLERYPIVGGIEPNKNIAREWYAKEEELRAQLRNR